MIVFSVREVSNLSVPVAQLDRVSVSEAEGLEFESQRARIFLLSTYKAGCFPGGYNLSPYRDFREGEGLTLA